MVTGHGPSDGTGATNQTGGCHRLLFLAAQRGRGGGSRPCPWVVVQESHAPRRGSWGVASHGRPKAPLWGRRGGGGNASRRGGHLEPRTRTRLNAQPSPGFDREGLLGLPNKVPLEGRVAAGKPPWLPLLRGPCVRPSLTKKRPPASALPSPRRRTAASPPGDAFSGAEPGREASFLMARSFQEDTGGRRKEDRKRENTCGFGSHTRACDVRTRKKGSTRLGDSTLSRSSAGQETDLGSTEIHGGLPRGSTPPAPRHPPTPSTRTCPAFQQERVPKSSLGWWRAGLAAASWAQEQSGDDGRKSSGGLHSKPRRQKALQAGFAPKGLQGPFSTCSWDCCFSGGSGMGKSPAVGFPGPRAQQARVRAPVRALGPG